MFFVTCLARRMSSIPAPSSPDKLDGVYIVGSGGSSDTNHARITFWIRYYPHELVEVQILEVLKCNRLLQFAELFLSKMTAAQRYTVASRFDPNSLHLVYFAWTASIH